MPKRHYIQIPDSNSITCSSNYGFFENIEDLTALLESIASDDAKKVKVSRIRCTLRIYSTTVEENFSILPVIVQTNGTLADGVNLGSNNVSDFIDTQCNDEFGFQEIGNMRVAKHMPDATTAHLWVVETAFDIPKNIINILNKEHQTERLQSLILAFLGKGQSTSFTLEAISHLEVFYDFTAKGIIIR